MKYVTIIGVLAILVAGLAYYIIFAVPSDLKSITDQSEISVDDSTNEEKLIEPPKGVGTLESLRLLMEDLECTITYTPDDNDVAIEGTYFVSDGNIRGDFLSESPDLSGQILSSIIINGTMMYTWSEIEGNSYGMKMDLAVTDKTIVETKQSVSLDTSVRYDCKNWENVDRTVFVPPSDVLFQDMNELMRAGMEYGTVYTEEEIVLPEMY